MKDLLQRCLGVMRRNIGLVVYFVLWVVIVGGFWFTTTNSDAFGYAVIAFYLVLPVLSFAVSIVYGIGEDTIKYYLPFLFGVMEILGGFLSFQLSNIISNGKWNTWNTPDLEMSLYSFIPAVLGVAIGMLIRLIRRKMASGKK